MAIPTSYSYVVGPLVVRYVTMPIIMTVTRTARTTRHRIKSINEDKHIGRPMFYALTRTPRSPFTNFIPQRADNLTNLSARWRSCRPWADGSTLIADTGCNLFLFWSCKLCPIRRRHQTHYISKAYTYSRGLSIL